MSTQTQTQVFFRTNDEGKKVKVTRTTQVEYIPAEITTERRNWPKYCHGPEIIAPPTPGDPVNLRLTPKAVVEAKPKKQVSKITCQYCGLNHLSISCSLRDKIVTSKNMSTPLEQPTKPGTYVPPGRRSDGGVMANLQKFMPPGSRSELGQRSDAESSLRITNLPKEVSENILREFMRFKRVLGVRRCHVVKFRDTNESRGFAFVGFDTKDAADRAKSALDGEPLMNQIIHAEYSQPRGQ